MTFLSPRTGRRCRTFQQLNDGHGIAFEVERELANGTDAIGRLGTRAGIMLAVRSLRAVLDHPRSGPTVRCALAGATVAGVYLATPLVLTSVLGFPIEAAIPLAYLADVCRHFNLQRRFVFRHVPVFALSTRAQVARYVAIGAIQPSESR